jgi:hypothetical protein
LTEKDTKNDQPEHSTSFTTIKTEYLKKLEGSLEEYKKCLKDSQFVSSFLYDSTKTFMSEAYDDIFGYIGKSLAKLVTNSIILVNEFDMATESTVLRVIEGDLKIIERLRTIIGKKLNGLTFRFPAEYRARVSSGALTRVPGGIYELSFEQLPSILCKTIEHSFGIGNVYAMAFAVEEDFLGTVCFVTFNKEPLINTKLIETFMHLAGLALHRRKAEMALEKANADLKAKVAKHSKELEQK